jgi:hypothetical protein
MPLDAEAIGRGCTAKVTQANQLCGLDLDRFKEGARDGAPITVACTQEARCFGKSRRNSRKPSLPSSTSARPAAGRRTPPRRDRKAAALIAGSGEDMPPISLVTLESSGVALIYGRDEIAIEAAQRLADRLDITVLLTKPGDVRPRRTNEFPGSQGHDPQCAWTSWAVRACDRRLRAASPSSRAKLVFGPSRNGATSTCDLILDLSGGAPLFSRHELRPGYLRADPRDRRASSARLRRPAAWSAPSTSRVHSIRSLAVRPFALRHHRLHALSRSLSDRRDHAQRQSGRDRPQCLRRLRLLCLSMPDGGGVLFAARRGCADAAAAHAAAGLSQGRRQRRHRAVSRRRARRRNHRRTGAVRDRDCRRMCCRCASTK